MHYFVAMLYLAIFKKKYICILSWPISTSPTSAPQVCAASGRLSLSVLRRYFPAATGWAYVNCTQGILSPIIANNSVTKTIYVHLLRPGFWGASGTHLSSEQDQFQPGGTGKEALEVWDDAKVKTTYQNISLKAVIKQTHCVNVVVKLLSAVTVNINKLFSVKVTSIEP